MWGSWPLAPYVAFNTTTVRQNLPCRMSLGSRKQQLNIDIITDGQGTNGFCLLAVAFSCRLGIAPPPYSLAASLCDCNFGLITPDRSDALKSGVTPSNLEEVDATSLFSQKQTFVSARGTSA